MTQTNIVISLMILGIASTAGIGQRRVWFSGHVRTGETFSRQIGKDLLFVIAPDPNGPDYGWTMKILHAGQNDDYSACVTGPFHGITGRDILGIQFLPGPDMQYDPREKEVISRRNFRFVLNLADYRKSCTEVVAAQESDLHQRQDGTWTLGPADYREPPVGDAKVVLKKVHLNRADKHRIDDFRFDASVLFPVSAKPSSSQHQR